MTKRLLFTFLIGLLILTSLLAACTTATTTKQTTTSTQITTTSSSSTTTAAKWWSKLGEPKNGGQINIRVNAQMYNGFDPWSNMGVPLVYDTLFNPDWTVDRNTWKFGTAFTPIEFWTGCMAQSWEQTDPTTLTVKLRKDVRWQNVPPLNGREFTADDVVYHYQRLLGIGPFTQPSAFHAARFSFVKNVVAVDKYTVQFIAKGLSVLAFLYIAEQSGQNSIEPREIVEMNGFKDWKNIITTGPWAIQDFVPGSSETYLKNANYWGYDERYPKNQLPYADKLVINVIPDANTALASLRTGKVDILSGITWQDADNLSKSNPELLKGTNPVGGQSIDPRWDKSPLSDVRVRQALNMSLDRKTIATTRWSGYQDGTPCGLITPAVAAQGWGFPYSQWSDDLKRQYSYDTKGAKALLAQAAADGVFKANAAGGFDTNIVAANTADMELVQICKAYFSEIGVNMTINVMDRATAVNYARQGNADQMWWNYAGKTGAVINVPIAYAMYVKGDGANYGFVNDPQYQSIIDKLTGASSLKEAQQFCQQLDKYQLERHFSISICPGIVFNVWSPSLGGYSDEVLSQGGSGGGWIYARMWKK
jgi:peptide/nickel transport system substrate-binding protein